MKIEKTAFSNFEEFKVFEALQKNDPECIFTGTNNDIELSRLGDIYSKDGIPSLEIHGETIIEVKRILNYAIINSLELRFKNFPNKYNLIVVYFHTSISNIPEDVTRNNRQFRYVDYRVLSHKKSIKENSADKYYLDKSKQEDWKNQRKLIINEASELALQGNNVLFLGAGVSASAHMPSWEELLQSLMGEVSILKGETLNAFKQLNSHVYEQCGDSNLIMARYLQMAIRLSGTNKSFASIIQKHLYEKEHNSELLSRIAQIIKQRKVDEVITYNFDDILEQELERQGLEQSKDFTSIAKDAEVSGHNTLPIYHVHGIIPEEGPTETVVFSEEEYHERYKDAFHWSNIEQLHAMSRMHCFFIGLSMIDPNLRRLLDISCRMNETNTIGHYAFLKRTKLDDYCLSNIKNACKYMHVSESLIDKKKQAEIYTLNYGVIENIFRELGVKVIWFEEFNELPELIAKVFKINIFKNADQKDLINSIKAKIDKIDQIERKLRSFNVQQERFSETIQFVQFVNLKRDEYKELIHSTDNMLNELSNRISFEKLSEINQLEKIKPEFNGNMNGFSDFFNLWLGTAVMLLDNQQN